MRRAVSCCVVGESCLSRWLGQSSPPLACPLVRSWSTVCTDPLKSYPTRTDPKGIGCGPAPRGAQTAGWPQVHLACGTAPEGGAGRRVCESQHLGQAAGRTVRGSGGGPAGRRRRALGPGQGPGEPLSLGSGPLGRTSVWGGVTSGQASGGTPGACGWGMPGQGVVGLWAIGVGCQGWKPLLQPGIAPLLIWWATGVGRDFWVAGDTPPSPIQALGRGCRLCWCHRGGGRAAPRWEQGRPLPHGWDSYFLSAGAGPWGPGLGGMS